jgi:hypothetical protein
MPQQLWTYIGWVIFTLFVFSIVVLVYALYRDYQLTKNKKTSLPSLEVIESKENKTFFTKDDTANDLAGDTGKIPSRRELRNAKPGTVPSSPAVTAKPSAFFDDDEEFTLTSGQD